MATPGLTTEASSADGRDIATAPSGPPPVATRHNHLGVIGRVSSGPRPSSWRAAVLFTPGSCSTT
jgi:hypothetical protein